MDFKIGTNNKEKVATAHKVLKQVIMDEEFKLEGLDVPSGFGETPVDEETKLGAHNRAKALLNMGCDYALGVESGLVERYGDTYEEAWCCIMSKSGIWYGYSSGLKVPNILTKMMKERGLEHFEALRTDEIREMLPIKDRKDTWANYSAHMLVRTISFEESIRNALVQIFAPSDSMYHK